MVSELEEKKFNVTIQCKMGFDIGSDESDAFFKKNSNFDAIINEIVKDVLGCNAWDIEVKVIDEIR